MYLTTPILATLFAATTLAAPPTTPPSASDSPFPYNTTTLTPRAATIMATYCEHSYHTTPCHVFGFAANTCFGLPRYWNDKISSFYPESLDSACTVYERSECRGKAAVLKWPGSNALVNEGMNDKISSVKCYRKARKE